MLTLPDNLPSTANAPLPIVYEAARTSLAECEKIDECKDWADKAAALASYARQAHDDGLRRMAERIQVRAIRRCGELLNAIESARGANLPNVGRKSSLTTGRAEAARDAGLSTHQTRTALRVASVPEHEFEELTEGDEPATVTELAVRGTQKKIIIEDHLRGRDPAEFQMAMHVGGDLRRIAEAAEKTDPAAFARGIDRERIPEMIDRIAAIQLWLDRMLTELEKLDV